MKNHIMLLGCPAVGKYTIGKKLSQILGYPLFDNAKVIDIVSLIYDFSTEDFRSYRDCLRFDFYNRLLNCNDKEIKGLISTNVLRNIFNWEYFDKVQKLFCSYFWNTQYIILKASENVLLERVENENRNLKHAINNKEDMLLWLNQNKNHSTCIRDNAIIIDTSFMCIDETVDIILKRINHHV